MTAWTAGLADGGGWASKIPRRSFGSAQHVPPRAWGWVLSAVRCLGLLRAIARLPGDRDHWKCESGSGASLDVPRSAKSDRMCRRRDTSASETAAHTFRDVVTC
jgi:hypothetical protein